MANGMRMNASSMALSSQGRQQEAMSKFHISYANLEMESSPTQAFTCIWQVGLSVTAVIGHGLRSVRCCCCCVEYNFQLSSLTGGHYQQYRQIEDGKHIYRHQSVIFPCTTPKIGRAVH